MFVPEFGRATDSWEEHPIEVKMTEATLNFGSIKHE